MSAAHEGAPDPADAARTATPSGHGRAPRGPRLPDETRLGPVHLQVANLDRSLTFYVEAMGLRVVDRGANEAAIAAHGDDRALVVLRERPGATPAGGRRRLGVFHVALLLPERAALGALVGHLAARGVRLGAGDHHVSEAFYLADPDGIGLEVYADRPREAWRRVGDEVLMTTDPVDVDDVLAAAEGRAWEGMPVGSSVGHVHLHVGDLERAGAFYGDGLGFHRTVWSYPGALFFGAGGYHHHVGTNTWAGPTAVAPADGDARLLEWTIELPEVRDVDAVASGVIDAGFVAERDGADLVAADPWGTVVRVRAAAVRP